MANGVNRFFRPASSGYVSQYIPQQLPAELMLAQLNQKQQEYNKAAQQAELLGDWKQDALPGDDTTYVQNKKKEIREFIDTFGQKVDPTTPEGIRQYQKFVRGIKDDENLKTIANQFGRHQEFLARDKKLKEGTATDYDKAFVYSYLKRFNEYTTPGSGGFAKLSLEDPNILAGVDIQKEGEKYFDDLKANGWESALKDPSSGYYYTSGYEGIKDERIRKQVENRFNNFYEGRAGQQLGARFDETQGVASYERGKMGKEYEEARRAYVRGELSNIGNEFEFAKYKTDKASALNKGVDEEKTNPVYNPLEFTGLIESNTLQDHSRDSQLVASNSQNIQTIQNQASWLNGAIKLMESGKSVRFNNLPQQYKDMLSGIPGFNEAMSTGILKVTPDNRKALQNLLQSKNTQFENLRTQNEEISNNEVNALSKTLDEAGIRILRGKSYAQAVNDFKSINPTQQEVIWAQANLNKFRSLKGDEFDKFIKENMPTIKAIYGSDHPRLAQRIENIITGVDALEKAAGVKDPSYYQNKLNELAADPIKNMEAIQKFKSEYDRVTDLNSKFKDNYKNLGSKQDVFIQVNPNEKYTTRIPQLDNQGNVISYNEGGDYTSDYKLQKYIVGNPDKVVGIDGEKVPVNSSTKLVGVLKTEKEPGVVTAKIVTTESYKQAYKKDDGTIGYYTKQRPVEKTVKIRDTDYITQKQNEVASTLRASNKFVEKYDRLSGKYYMAPTQPLSDEESRLFNIYKEKMYDNITSGISTIEKNLDRKPRELAVDKVNIGGGNYNLNVQKNESGITWYLTNANGQIEPIGRDSQGNPVTTMTSVSVPEMKEYLINMEQAFKLGR